MAKRTSKTADGEESQPKYLLITEEQSHGYYHQYARVVVSRYQDGERFPYGTHDRYDGPMYSGLRARCQGDQSTRLAEDRTQATYGSDVGYSDMHHIDLGDARRMVKMLERIKRGLDKLDTVRGYARSWPQYVGRLAEVLGCAGIVVDRGENHQRRSGYRYDWMTIGDGVNAADMLIYSWQRAGRPEASAAASEVA